MFKKHSFLLIGFLQLFILAIPMIAHCLSDNILYQELNNYIYIGLPMVISGLIAFLQIHIMRISFPGLFSSYQQWASRGKEHATIYFFLIAAGYFLLLFIIFGYSDQYHVNTPIKPYEFIAYERYKTHHRRSGVRYYTVFISPLWGKYEISGENYYDTVGQGDSMTLFLRQGRLHTYFVVDSKLNKLLPVPYKNVLTNYASEYFKSQDYNLNFH
jgi:hypothetical protein